MELSATAPKQGELQSAESRAVLRSLQRVGEDLMTFSDHLNRLKLPAAQHCSHLQLHSPWVPGAGLGPEGLCLLKHALGQDQTLSWAGTEHGDSTS